VVVTTHEPARELKEDRPMEHRALPEVEAARLTGRRFRQKSNPTDSEVHVMSTKPSGMHPPTEDANDEPREAR
jgi:hypothetical protein